MHPLGALLAFQGGSIRGIAVLLFLALVSTLVRAGSFEVNPVRVDMSPAVRSVALSVRNAGTEAVVVQVSVQSWAQENGADVLAATSEILVSPPIATIPSGAEQIIRVGLRRAPDEKRELSYRLFLQEVPPPPKPGFQGLTVALRISLPIFVQPRQGSSKAELVWNAELRDDGMIRLKMDNRGTGHIQISDIQMSLPGEAEPVVSQSAAAYVLPGQSRQWDLKPRHSRVKKADRLHLKVSTDAGSVSNDIGLEGP